MPVEVPSGVQVDIKGSNVHVKGPKGELKRTFSPLIGIKMDGNVITVERKSDAPAERALQIWYMVSALVSKLFWK
jgi:large subunit ribosomal protein L6